MALQVIVPPAAGQFSTLSTLRDEIPAAVPCSDTRLTRLLAVASSAIGRYIRPVALATYQDDFTLNFRDGYTDSRPLTLSVPPIGDILQVGNVAGSDLGSAISVDQGNGIIQVVDTIDFTDATAAGTAGILGWYQFVDNTEQMAVRYTGGYAMPGQTGANLPAELEQAAIESVRSLLSNTRDQSIRSEMVQGVGSTSYNNPSGTLPDHVMAMLEPWHEYGI